MNECNFHIKSLPKELWFGIVQFLKFDDRVEIGKTCSTLMVYAKSPDFWKYAICHFLHYLETFTKLKVVSLKQLKEFCDLKIQASYCSTICYDRTMVENHHLFPIYSHQNNLTKVISHQYEFTRYDIEQLYQFQKLSHLLVMGNNTQYRFESCFWTHHKIISWESFVFYLDTIKMDDVFPTNWYQSPVIANLKTLVISFLDFNQLAVRWSEFIALPSSLQNLTLQFKTTGYVLNGRTLDIPAFKAKHPTCKVFIHHNNANLNVT